jgi:hypothetical protein
MDNEDLVGAAEEIETALPLVLSGESDDLDMEAVDGVFAQVLSRLSPLEAESMGSALQRIGRWAGDRERLGQVASTVLPTTATALGTVYGGPLGGALGKSVGERAAQAVAGRPSRPPTPSPPPATPAPPSGTPPTPTPATPATGSPAAAQLLYLAQNPAFLSSLVALALGSQGQSTVPVGGGDREVPVAALVNLATNLAGRVAEDADALLGAGDESSDAYLRDETGGFTCDPAVPAQRAEALLRLLQQEDEAAWMLGDTDEEAWGDDAEEAWWQAEW